MKQLIPFTTKGQCIAEFFGTGLVVFFSTAYLSAMKLTNVPFNQWEISIICGISVAVSIYFTSNFSGAHLNPAVTIVLWFFSNFEKKKILPYILAQLLGSFFATALVYMLYYNLFFNYEHTHNIIRGSKESLDLASVFSIYPSQYVSIVKSFFIEMITTAFLLFFILSMTEDGNNIFHGYLSPILIGILVILIGISIGPLTNFSLNPARDFGPKTFAFLAGWGKIAYTGDQIIPYFLVPIIAPIIGAFLGAFGYRFLTENYLFNYLKRETINNISIKKK